MTEQEEKYFDAAREMFNTDGWKNFITDIENNVANVRVENIDDANGFWIAKGQLNVMQSILGYENMIRATEEADESDA